MQADDYDRWCENRDICHRRLGDGHDISETKGNYFYGWMTPEGVTSGSFDIVIRTNHGNRLENSNEYYGEVNGHYTPDGVPQFELVPLETERFNCYGGSDDGCYFP